MGINLCDESKENSDESLKLADFKDFFPSSLKNSLLSFRFEQLD